MNIENDLTDNEYTTIKLEAMILWFQSTAKGINDVMEGEENEVAFELDHEWLIKSSLS